MGEETQLAPDYPHPGHRTQPHQKAVTRSGERVRGHRANGMEASIGSRDGFGEIMGRSGEMGRW